MQQRDSAKALLLPLTVAGAALAVLAAWHYQRVLPFAHDSLWHYRQTLEAALWWRDPAALWAHFAGLPGKYMPLTYLTGAGLLRAFDFAWWTASSTILLFLALALAGLVALGRRLGPSALAAALPLCALLATKTAWVAATSYNLEASLLAGAVLLLALFFAADRLPGWVFTAAGAVLIFVLAQAKTVLLLPVLPLAAVMCFTGDAAVRRRRRIWLGALVLSAVLWLAPHVGRLSAELAIDYVNPSTEKFPGTGHYAWLVLIEYRGLPLILALAALLIFRRRQKDLATEDLALALFFVVPLVFFTLLDTKRAWYLLAGYLALPAWFLWSAGRCWDAAWVRRLAVAVGALYLIMAAANVALAAWSLHDSYRENRFAVVEPPALPVEMPAATLRELVQRGQRAYAERRWETSEAHAFFQLWLKLNPVDPQMLGEMARSLARRGETARAMVYWDALFANPLSFHRQIEALRAMAELATEGLLAPEICEERLSFLIARHRDEPELLYSLYSTRVYARRLWRNHEGALTAIGELRGVLAERQRAGVNLSEAQVRRELEQPEQAEKLLETNRREADRSQPVYAESLLLLAELRAARGAFDAAESLLAEAAAAKPEPNTLAMAALRVAGEMRRQKQAERAASLLTGLAANLSGQAAGLLHIELGKLASAAGQYGQARQYFTAALAELTDATLRDWVEQTLTDLPRLPPKPQAPR